MLTTILLFIFAVFLLWKASAIVLEALEAFSNSTRLSSFIVSFLILGILTSLTEISVGLNAVIEGKPGIFVGNLIGGSFVILAGIIPFLAMTNGGVVLKKNLSNGQLMTFMILLLSPSLVILDGFVSVPDAILVLLLYGMFVYFLQKKEGVVGALSSPSISRKDLLHGLARIFLGAGLIFLASHIIVDATVFFAEALRISPFLVSLLVLSIGTNLPEISIALKSAKSGRSDIAFGDYVGSAAFNVMLFGFFTLLHGPFALEAKGFSVSFGLIALGYAAFFLFARSKSRLSPMEGMVLLMIYLLFLLTQVAEIAFISPRL